MGQVYHALDCTNLFLGRDFGGVDGWGLRVDQRRALNNELSVSRYPNRRCQYLNRLPWRSCGGLFAEFVLVSSFVPVTTYMRYGFSPNPLRNLTHIEKRARNPFRMQRERAFGAKLNLKQQ